MFKHLEKLAHAGIGVSFLAIDLWYVTKNLDYLFGGEFFLQDARLYYKLAVIFTLTVLAVCFLIGTIFVDISRNTLLLLTISTLTLGAVESILRVVNYPPLTDTKAEMFAKSKAYLDLAALGHKAYFYIEPSQFIRDNSARGTQTITLTNPGLSSIVYTTIESNGVITWTTDPDGFRNDNHRRLNEPIDVYLAGDSFTEGCCVPGPHTIASVMTSQTGWNVVNAGGAGLPHMVSVFLLYGLPLEPKTVVLNLLDARSVLRGSHEIRNSRIYEIINGADPSVFRPKEEEKLETATRIHAQQLTEAIHSIIAQDYDFSADGIARQIGFSQRAAQIFGNLRIFRLYLAAATSNNFDQVPVLCREAETRKWAASALKTMAAAIKGYGGKFIVGYIPDTILKSKKPDHCERHVMRDIADAIGVTFVDFGEALDENSNPMQNFAVLPSRPGFFGHLNKEGYAKVAQRLIQVISGERSDASNQ